MSDSNPAGSAAGARAVTPRPGGVQVMSGRYAVFSGGVECGEEQWRLVADGDRLIVTGEQETVRPHPFPSRLAYRATLTSQWRVTGLEIQWRVGEREVAALHEASGERWRVRIHADGQVREQEGDYPAACEVESLTHLTSMFILARRDFQVGGEHEFPVLRIGPPIMAVSPERMLLRCVEQATIMAPAGPVRAKRYVLTLPPRGEEDGYTFWADEDGLVLESFEGPAPLQPWMRLVTLERG